MTSQSPKKRLRYEATCPVCLGYFTEPVTLDCGHNFCQACITRSWQEPGKDAICPQCRRDVGRDLKPNWSLVNLVEISQELGLPAARGTGQEELECTRHQEPLKLFCKEDEVSVCMVCSRSKEHKDHGLIPVEEAAQEYKEELHSSLDNLRKKSKNIQECKMDKEKVWQDLLKRMEAEREDAVAKFKDLCQFLEQQEKHLLGQMKTLQKEFERERDEHLAGLSANLSALDSLIQEMEEKVQQPAGELLQGIRSSLERCEGVFEVPLASSQDLKWRIVKFCDTNLFLTGVMKHLKDRFSAFELLDDIGKPSL